MSNVLIVESKNDKIFIESLVSYLNFGINIEVIVNEYETLEGLSKKSLIDKLGSLKARNLKKPIDKLGIIIDIDNFNLEERLEFTNNCLQEAFPSSQRLDKQSEFIEISTSINEIKVASYFTNVNGKGELETVLKAIKSQDSSHADCLQDWEKCIKNQKKNIKQKDFDKFWLNIYIRYDTCSNKEKKQAERKCSIKNFEYIMQKKTHIWDFEHQILNELKDFLQLFVNE